MSLASTERSGPTLAPGAVLAFLAGAGLLAWAGATGTAVLVLAALPLLVAPLVGLAAAPRGASAARLEWSLGGEGAEVELRGRLVPAPPMTPADISVRIDRPPTLTEGRPATLTRTREAVTFVRHWRAPHPMIAALSPPSVQWQDPLGLVEAPVTVAGPSLAIERYPPEVSRIGAVRLRHTTPQPGEVRSSAVGDSGEFFAVRPAAPTDPPRRINWPATARSGHLVANDFYLERTGDLVLLLDLRPTSLGPARDAALLAIARAGALGIANGFLAEKARVGLGLFDEFLTAIPLASGRRQQYRIAAALATAQVAPVAGPSERLGVSMRRYFPPGVTTVLLSPLADDESLIVVTHLRRRGYPTTVLSPSPIPLLEPPSEEIDADAAAALRLLRLARRLRVGRAWREGPVVEWSDYWSLSPFVRFLSAPPRPSRGVG